MDARRRDVAYDAKGSEAVYGLHNPPVFTRERFRKHSGKEGCMSRSGHFIRMVIVNSPSPKADPIRLDSRRFHLPALGCTN